MAQKQQSKTDAAPLADVEYVGDHVVMPAQTFEQILERLLEAENVYRRRSWWRP